MYFTSLDMVSHGWPDSRNPIVQAVMPVGTTLNGSTECFHTVLHISKSYCNTMDVKRLERMRISAI